MNENLFERPEFQCMGPEKIEILKEMIPQTKGKTPAELMGIFTKYKSRLSGGNQLSEQERNALLLALRESLEEQEQRQFDRAMELMRIMGR